MGQHWPRSILSVRDNRITSCKCQAGPRPHARLTAGSIPDGQRTPPRSAHAKGGKFTVFGTEAPRQGEPLGKSDCRVLAGPLTRMQLATNYLIPCYVLCYLSTRTTRNNSSSLWSRERERAFFQPRRKVDYTDKLQASVYNSLPPQTPVSRLA